MKLFRPSLTTQIFVGLIAGILIGALWPALGQALKPYGGLFLRLIKCIIAPLIFSTLVVGIAGAGTFKQIGRIGLKALIYFEIVTTFALFIGLGAVNLMKPGVGVHLQADHSKAKEAEVTGHKQTFAEAVLHIVPTSVVDAMAKGDVLQIVFFSVLFGAAVAAAGPRGDPVFRACESLAEIMFKFTGYIMHYAPFGVGAAIAATVSSKGLAVLIPLIKLIATLYLALFFFLLFVLGPVCFIARVPIRKFLLAIREPVLLAFSTTSSEAALPKAMEAMEGLGVPRRIVSFVMPTGYSFNLDGTTLYLSLASIFVAQAAGIHLSWGQQILMLLTLMITSKGVAGVPRASLVILAGTLASFDFSADIVAQGILVILGVDEVMDMARTAVNVVGNCLATFVVGRWEGAIQDTPQEELLPQVVDTQLS
ncbi:MAG: cation:dicarboxylase symporter family transporter [Acidobacteria bacterium]|nr:cation:dicarboxylase symporter family transporter [Acidobacteriota bacterium]MBI3658615.1 cation:dicarboxylase symporter family transporter [Acidobacteriota bacterium]